MCGTKPLICVAISTNYVLHPESEWYLVFSIIWMALAFLGAIASIGDSK